MRLIASRENHGFAKANKERTEANAYATLMELETAMRDMNANVTWLDPDSIAGRGAPARRASTDEHDAPETYGVFDLSFDWTDGRWQLVGCLD